VERNGKIRHDFRPEGGHLYHPEQVPDAKSGRPVTLGAILPKVFLEKSPFFGGFFLHTSDVSQVTFQLGIVVFRVKKMIHFSVSLCSSLNFQVLLLFLNL
jgi:hypothetical protein